jgi:hypothetical protein
MLPENIHFYLSYVFSTQRQYSYLALKALLMLNSVYPKHCQITSRLIILRFTKSRWHSQVLMPLTLIEASNILSFCFKRPINLESFSKSHVNEAKYFVFPGYVKYLKLRSWKFYANLSLPTVSTSRSYWFFFYKTAFLE